MLAGVFATFSGSGLGSVSHEWEVSSDGINWAGTGDTDTTGPAMVLGQFYRLTSSVSNSGGTATSSSAAIGPARAPIITMTGLTNGEALVGTHGSIGVVADIGTITAYEWASAPQ